MPKPPNVDETQTIVYAASVIVFRTGPEGSPEILMVERSKNLRFAAAASVFPGGKVDPADVALAERLGLSGDAATKIAAVRELLEETGLMIGIRDHVDAPIVQKARKLAHQTEGLASVLDTFGWTIDLEGLVPFAHWLPMHKAGRIFDTKFYLYDLGSGAVELTADNTESTRLFWTTASDALHAVASGQISAIFPTLRNLERLAQFDSFAAARAHADTIPLEPISPTVEFLDGVEMLRIPDAAGYPITLAPRF